MGRHMKLHDLTTKREARLALFLEILINLSGPFVRLRKSFKVWYSLQFTVKRSAEAPLVMFRFSLEALRALISFWETAGSHI